MESTFVKIVVFVPVANAEAIRGALGDSGAGKIGNYSHASFSSRGAGRFLPMANAHPAIGAVGKYEEVEEERVEIVCLRTDMEKVIAAVMAVHPYEEPAIDVYPVEVMRRT